MTRRGRQSTYHTQIDVFGSHCIASALRSLCNDRQRFPARREGI